MKTLKNSIALLLLITLIIGCKKNKDPEYVITGRLMSTCDEPAPNIEGLRLSQPSSQSGFGKEAIYKGFSSDSEGYFKITFKESEANSYPMFLEDWDTFLEGISPFQDTDLGEVLYGTQTFSFVLKLKGNNSYTKYDTLSIPDFNNPMTYYRIYIPGPFNDTILDTIIDYHFSDAIQFGGDSKFVFQTYMKDDFDHWNNTTVSISSFCNNNLYTAEIKVE